MSALNATETDGRATAHTHTHTGLTLISTDYRVYGLGYLETAISAERVFPKYPNLSVGAAQNVKRAKLTYTQDRKSAQHEWFSWASSRLKRLRAGMLRSVVMTSSTRQSVDCVRVCVYSCANVPHQFSTTRMAVFGVGVGGPR